MRKFLSGLVVVSSLLVHAPAVAQTASANFSDVPTNHPAYQAIVYLQSQGILKGYSDGTFKPNQLVERAAAVKMVLAGRITDEQAASLQNPGFSDIGSDAWYKGYVAKAVELGIIDGPNKSPAFNGGKAVVLAEFLKILLRAQQMDANAYSEITSPLAVDVTDANAWFYPYVRLGMASSILQVDANGNLNPNKQLTRADVAMAVYHLLMYKQQRRTQALLTLAETELSGNVIGNLNPQGLTAAKMAQARALLAVRGALTSRPDVGVVKGAVKVTEGFGALVRAYEAGVSGKLDDVLTLTKQAYDLANQAKEFTSTLNEIAASMQTIAHNMANEARAKKGQ